MGVVYKARQKTLNRFVALKLLAPERVREAKFAERFTREAQALAALNHPNIVTIYDFGQAGGFYYLLMEFVDGVNLRQLLRARKFTPEEALAIVPPLCDALQFAHDRGIVHRDIKPENLLVDKTGRVKVADFGIAKMIEPDPGRADLPVSPELGVAQPGSTGNIGTPGYSAPEQKTDPQRVDSRADIYSLGVVFYEMLTGELPGQRLEPPSKKVQIDVRLDEVVLRALEQNPGLRYQQVSEVKTMVETIATTPRASGESAPASVNLPKDSPCCVSTPEHLRTFLGRHFHHFLAKGQLRLDKESLIFDSGWTVVRIPLSSISALALGAFPTSVFTLIKTLATPGLYVAVTFAEQGASRTLLFTPTPPLSTAKSWIRYHFTGPTKKILEFSMVLSDWSRALQNAVQARTGTKLPLSHEAKTPSKWINPACYLLGIAIVAMSGQRPFLSILKEMWPGLVTTALASVNALPGIARVAVSGAISLIDAGLWIFVMVFCINLLMKLSMAIGPLSRKRTIQFANSFPRQSADFGPLLTLLDGGKYAEAWESAVPCFQRSMSKEEWVAQLKKIRQPLGRVISRKVISMTFPSKLRSLQEAAVGTRWERKFITSFDGQRTAVETVTFALQPNGEWRPISYLMRPHKTGRYWIWFGVAGLILAAILLAIVSRRNGPTQIQRPSSAYPKPNAVRTLTGAPFEAASAFQVHLVAPETTTAPVDVLPNADTTNVPRQFRVLREILFDGSAVAQAGIGFDRDGWRILQMPFTEAGARHLGEITASNIHQRIAYVYHGAVFLAPFIETRISSGVIIPIRSRFGLKELHAMVDCLNRASVPTDKAWTFTAIRERVVMVQTPTNNSLGWLDLESGILATNKKERQGYHIMLANGFDLIATVAEEPRFPVVTGFDIVIERLPANAWDATTPADVIQSWDLMHTKPDQLMRFGAVPGKSDTFLFQTKEGAKGILQASALLRTGAA